MSKSCHPFLSICGLVFSLALLPLLRAEETRPAVPPPPPVAASAPVAEKTAEAAPAEDKAVENPEKKPDSELRDLGGDKDEPTDKPLKKRPGRRAHGVHATVDDAPVFGDQTVEIGRAHV